MALTKDELEALHGTKLSQSDIDLMHGYDGVAKMIQEILLELGKLKCGECGALVHTDNALRAGHPFDVGAIVLGCPSCCSIDSFEKVCDEPGCTEVVCAGTPTPAGYRLTCGKHMP